MAVERVARVTPEAETVRLLFEVMAHLRHHFETCGASLDLSPPQAKVLRMLDRPRAMGELATAMMCDASNITGIVDRLEARGMVARQSDPRDRRVKQIVLTQTGGRTRDELSERLGHPAAGMLELTAEEHEQLSALLRRAMGTRADG